MRSAGRLAYMLMLAAASACRAQQAPAQASVPAAPPAELGGVWSTVVNGTARPSGDRVVEHQEWHLSQQAESVHGYYLSLVSVTSADGRPFVCNRRTSFSTTLRIAVRGNVQGSAVALDETAANVAPGECTPSNRELRQWRGRASGNSLDLLAGSERSTLRREPSGRTELQARAEAAFAAPPPSPPIETGPRPERAPGGAATDVSGIWVWEHRGPAANGDDKEEREEWHLQQDGSRIRGYYDRLVRQISTDGNAYQCSMALEFRIATRFRVVGDVTGDHHVVLRENGYEVLDPGPCDNGVRRLDTYEGDLRADELRLVAGPGVKQVLHRARPNIPTQRF